MWLRIVLAQGMNTVFIDQPPTFSVYKQFPFIFAVREAVEVFEWRTDCGNNMQLMFWLENLAETYYLM